ncbi:hypothetical protein SOCEGT47_036960 [Sorangium cellulosum]|uniref:Response regulatory domain-containing protein n=1 Tax=Sorangium cellulosum TaxID=56 RepID=A0A4P2Q2I4_SORCE|nr:hypothetical protein [Sorangium cellulosum]AUX23176.1 hypothetical protein SOCEGT47_036960 [Sorangium cellulosum]
MIARRAARERATPASERLPASEKLQVVGPRGPGPRAARGFRVLLAHDARAATCDALALALESSMANVEIVDASSIDDALLASATERFDAFLVCLDLPPAPLGGVRLASELVETNHPVVLVTRSLRWVPPDRPALLELPWIPPDAAPGEITRAIEAATSDCDSMVRSRAPLSGDMLRAQAVRARR